MNNKLLILMILILLLGGLCIAYLYDDNFKELNVIKNDKESLSLVMAGPLKLDDLVMDIKSRNNRGIDNKTLEWMETLGEKYVYISDDAYVVMNKADADKIPMELVTDVSITYYIKCNVIEKHSLGNMSYIRYVYYVDDVEYINQKIVYYEV